MSGQLPHPDTTNTVSFNDRDESRIAAKAYARLVAAWKLSDSIAAKMISVSPLAWTQIKNGTWDGLFNEEQWARIGAAISLCKALRSNFDEDAADRWVSQPNTGPMFSGRKPVEVMVEGGLPMITATRDYVHALLNGL
ncbi:MAG: DUF2384 domain-containing protein [Hyphomicrobiales bacterium]|nr:DUF2384 domain-containing protein [Hyphomicrobiales bacterium]MCY4032780.1 DUF2384 domain-containing protein [Hyphomicrobiales bacterium]MCY4038973.1 DUF2384 domain-containing protein [Hyphomicrobiales bacterium]